MYCFYNKLSQFICNPQLLRLIRFMLNPYVFFASDLKGLSGNKKGTKDPDDPLSRKVPRAGIEPALLAELDFESSASTSSATPASGEKRAVPLSQPPEKGKRLGFGGEG